MTTTCHRVATIAELTDACADYLANGYRVDAMTQQEGAAYQPAAMAYDASRETVLLRLNAMNTESNHYKRTAAFNAACDIVDSAKAATK